MENKLADYHWGLLEQPTCSFESLLVARTLVDLQRKEVPLRLMNLSNQQQVIHKGTELACCETIDSVLASRADIEKGTLTGCTQNAKILMQLPPHLKEHSVTVLEETECQEVQKLLNEFSDIFSAGPHDLGCTDLIKHQIHTGEAPPIWQPVRRLPLAKQGEAERSIQELRELDVIEPSASLWSSPIVIVNKKDGNTRSGVDYRKLNDVTHKDSYPLPCVDDTILLYTESQEWLLVGPIG